MATKPTLYYVRHGVTDWNIAGRLQGQRDIPLNNEGRSQAGHCARILSQLFEREGRAASDYAYVSSPLMRSRETMEIMRGALGIDPRKYEVDQRLAEISFGEWEGLTYSDVLQRDRDVIGEREGQKWHFRPPGGETYEEVAQRVAKWHATVQDETVVSAHGGTARALAALLGILQPDDAAHLPIDHGVVYAFVGNQMTRHT